MLKVSYLVPLYNKEDFIEECIESILQENSEQFEIEICVVDDGSLDNSLKIVQEKYGSNERVKVASFPKNKGKNAACNKAFEISTGDYICLFGADDIVIKGRTGKLLECSVNNSNKAAYGGLIAKNENLTDELYRSLPLEQNLYTITMANGLSGGCVLIPRALCKNIFPIPEKLKFEDWWIAYFLVKNNNFILLKEFVTYYRIGSNNDCAFKNDHMDALYNAILKDYQRHIDYLEKIKEEDSLNPYLDKSFDLRNSFLDKKINKFLYLKNFDIYSLKIILFKLFGAKVVYRCLNFLKKIRFK